MPTTMPQVSTKKVSKKQALRHDLGEGKYNKLKRTSKTLMSDMLMVVVHHKFLVCANAQCIHVERLQQWVANNLLFLRQLQVSRVFNETEVKAVAEDEKLLATFGNRAPIFDDDSDFVLGRSLCHNFHVRSFGSSKTLNTMSYSLDDRTMS